MEFEKAEILRVVERARIELLYTRSILRTCIDSPEYSNDVSAMLSRCTDTLAEADMLIAKLRHKG